MAVGPVTGPVSRESLMCLACTLVLMGACVSAGDRRTRDPVPTDPLWTTNEDSLAAVDKTYSELDAVGDINTGVDPQTTATVPPRRVASQVRRRTAGSPALELRAIDGRRSHYEARAELPGAVALGLKSRDGTRLGFVTYRGRGVVRAVHVGNLALHMGERLVLGRRGGRFPPTVWSPVRGGVRVAPSLSSWFGQNGLAVATSERKRIEVRGDRRS